MIVGTGVDITEVGRIEAAVKRFGDRFLHRVFTPAEVRYCMGKPNAAERLAARFAAKEAGMKAIGTGLRHGVTWQDVEVLRLPGQRPSFAISRQGGRVCRATRLQAHSPLSFPHQGAGDCARDTGRRLVSFNLIQSWRLFNRNLARLLTSRGRFRSSEPA